jgi:membrane protein DedA with SNARE-associated domain
MVDQRSMLNITSLSLPNTPFLPYLLVSLAAVLEGPLTLLATGALASSGLLLPLPAFLSVVSGNLAADMGWYGVGRLGKLEWLEKVYPKLRIDQEKVDQLGLGIQKYAPRMLFLSKLTVGFPIPTLIAVGLNRIPIRRWLVMLLLGELVKTTVLISIGYLYAKAIQQASNEVQAMLWGITILVIVGMAFWIKRKKINLSK